MPHLEVVPKRRIPLEQLHPARRTRRIVENVVLVLVGLSLVLAIIGFVVLVGNWR